MSLYEAGRALVVLYLIELIDVRVCAVDDVDKTLIGNDHQTCVFLWQGADKGRAVGKRNGGEGFEGSQVVDLDKRIWEWDRLP